MNILFLTENEISPLQGGTERITHTLAQEFMERGLNCFSAWCIPCTMPVVSNFSGKQRIEEGKEETVLDSFIKKNEIDIVICNLVNIKYKRILLPAVFRVTRNTATSVVACYHAMPGEELIGNTLRSSLYRISRGRNITENLKDVLLSLTPDLLLKTLFRKYIRDRYRLMYDNCDKLVLLSDSFHDEFATLGEIETDDKFCTIHNALSFDTFLKPEDIGKKEKTVMMLSRMDEKSKRITLALRVWKKVNLSGNHEEWKLVLVGGGADLDWFKKIAKRMRLRNISFKGRQEEIMPYYKNASIFMLTSAYEGWGITLTEAQQNGVVPIAFNTYASLRDIIDDGKNGIIVQRDDIRAFADRLMWLMDHKTRREEMARAGLESSQRFQTPVIADKWIDLFKSLTQSL